MSGMEGHGRAFNVIPTADGVFVNMAYHSGVTFIMVGASDTYTLQSSATASGGANLASMKHYFTNSTANGSTAWTEVTLASGTSTAVIGTGNTSAAVTAAFVGADQLPDGHRYVKVTSTGSGLVYVITHDLVTQRKPSNLPALGV